MLYINRGTSVRNDESQEALQSKLAVLALMAQQSIVPGKHPSATRALLSRGSQMNLRHMLTHALEVHLVSTAASAPATQSAEPRLPIAGEMVTSQMPRNTRWCKIV